MKANSGKPPVLRHVLEWFLIVGLLILAYFSVKGVIQEYMAEETSFSISKQPLTDEDQPTLTICLAAETKLVYGEDFEMETVGDSNQTVSLELQRVNEVHRNNITRSIILKQLEVTQRTEKDKGSPYLIRSCITIHVSFKGSFDHEIHEYFLLGQFVLSLSNKNATRSCH